MKAEETEMNNARRRLLMVFFATGGAALTMPAGAQREGRLYRIAVLGNENTAPWEGFRQGLRELGYIDGRNVVVDWRWSEGKPERLPALAREAVALKPDVIVASGTQAVRAAKEATSTIPIVMAVSSYPEKIGLVESLARPGGNVTGLTNVAPELGAKRLELLKELAPGLSRVAVVWNPASPVEKVVLKDFEATATALGVSVRAIEARRPEELSSALAALASAPVDALLAHGNPVNFAGRQVIAEFALKNRLPSMFEERLFVEAGGLMSYAPNFADLFRRSAAYVDKILGGAKPAELPVEQPTTFDLVINLKTAGALGIAVPATLRLRANHLLE